MFDEKLAWHLESNCNCHPGADKQHPFLITHDTDVAFTTVLNLRVLGTDEGYVLFDGGRVIYMAGDVSSLHPITYYVFEMPPEPSCETVIRSERPGGT